MALTGTCAALGLAALLVTHSRGAWLGLGIATLLASFLFARRVLWKYRVAIGGAGRGSNRRGLHIVHKRCLECRNGQGSGDDGRAPRLLVRGLEDDRGAPMARCRPRQLWPLLSALHGRDRCREDQGATRFRLGTLVRGGPLRSCLPPGSPWLAARSQRSLSARGVT